VAPASDREAVEKLAASPGDVWMIDGMTPTVEYATLKTEVDEVQKMLAAFKRIVDPCWR
jgi:hypothetical protein